MKVAIEGMDGTGKSTISKVVANILEYHYIEKPLKDIFNISSDEFDNLCNKIYSLNDENIKALFFGLGNLIALKKDNIIIDKHILGTYFWNKTDSNENIFNLLVELGVVPDLTIILYASQESRIRHLKSRNKNDKDLLDEKKLSFGYDKMLDFSIKYNIPYIIINSDNYDDLKELIKYIVEIIKSYENKDIERINYYKNNQDEDIKKLIYEIGDNNE